MTNTEIQNQIIEIQKENPNSILWDICEKALTDGSENLITFLLEEYGDRSLQYHFDESFFQSHLFEIQQIVKDNLELAQRHVTIDNFVIESSWLAYQVKLQFLLIRKLKVLPYSEMLYL